MNWSDIDLQRGSLSVRRALQRQKGKVLVFAEPKTDRSRRTVLLATGTVAALRKHRGRQQEERLQMGPLWEGHDLVFTNVMGGPLDAGNVRESFGRRLKAAGLPPYAFMICVTRRPPTCSAWAFIRSWCRTCWAIAPSHCPLTHAVT